MSKRFVRTVALIGIAVMLSGCATITQGKNEKVTIDSTPRGADVLVDRDQHFITPATVYLKRTDPHTFVFAKDGYQEDHEALTSSATGAVWGNYGLASLGAVGILTGYIVDQSSGASNELSSNYVKVTLVPISPPPSSTPVSSGQSQGTALTATSTGNVPNQQRPRTPPLQGTAARAADVPPSTNAAGTNSPR
jgi:hypothetical protein